MKAFFTQPIGQLARQNALGFIGCNLYLIVINFGSFDSIEAVDKIFNFAWGFTLLALIIAGYNLVEDQVPEYWRMATGILAAVIITGTLLELAIPEFQENGFVPMYFLWAFNSLIYVLTMRGTGIFRPIYEYFSIFGYISIFVASGSNVFLDYVIPESIQPIFGLGWIAMVIGLGYGGYVAWGDKLASDSELE